MRNTLVISACLALVASLGGPNPGASAAANDKENVLPKYAPSAQELKDAYERADKFGSATAGKVFKERIAPHWFANDTCFWYRNDNRGGTKEFILVEAAKGTRKPVFDHAKLAEALTKASGDTYTADKLPFGSIHIEDDLKAVQFKVKDTVWQCDLYSYACSKTDKSVSFPAEDSPPDFRRRRGGRDPEQDRSEPARRTAADDSRPTRLRSPDGKWFAFARDYDVYVRGSGDEVRLSNNTDQKQGFGVLTWSPDSKTLIAYRIEPGDYGDVYKIESSPRGGGRAKLHIQTYAQPGDRFNSYEMWLFDIDKKTATKAEIEPIDFDGPPTLRWKPDSKHFTFERTDRGHQRFRVIEIDVATGKARNLIEEKSSTFINSYLPIKPHYFEGTQEILWSSEQDGWNHLYLTDAKTGAIKHQVTKGPWVVRGIDKVDEKERQIWFRASGMNPDQDPYLIHFYRTNFDGTGLVALTAGDGLHSLQYSPDRKYLIDTYSRVDLPPIHELRLVATGALVCELEKADASALLETGWKMPEPFHAKGRDGKTDIWGVVCRPNNLDPSRRYAVLEDIYAGPQDSFVPKTWGRASYLQTLAQLGFIVVQIDGMGTMNRSKAFHDVCWKNLADAGLPDHILWLQELARRYPYIDLDRVGIFGTSAGGQNSTGAMLFHPEFYKAAVSSCGCHDNRIDKYNWNEQWMGYPVGPHYAAQSNITNAHKLKGKLMLLVGEQDTNVPPESTYRLVDALIKSKKDFEFILLPGMDHSDGGPYGERRRRDFFVRHLHGVEPPDRNGP
jgi:dipeptidyl aminopeptidase/acylaminoacyl peptidase